MKKKFVKPEIKSIRLRLRDNILAGSNQGNQGTQCATQSLFNNNKLTGSNIVECVQGLETIVKVC